MPLVAGPDWPEPDVGLWLWPAVAASAVLVGSGVKDLRGDEVKGWIGRVPSAILRVASLRVPAAQRRDLHRYWVADLLAYLNERTDRPLARVLVGVRFSAGLIRGARAEAAILEADGLDPRLEVARVWIDDGAGERYECVLKGGQLTVTGPTIRVTVARPRSREEVEAAAAGVLDACTGSGLDRTYLAVLLDSVFDQLIGPRP